MAPPQVVAVGTQAQTATAGGVGPVTPGIPAGTTTNHIMVLVVESSNQTVNAITGWNNIGVGSVAQATGLVTMITARWKVAGASETAPNVSIAAGGNHVIARIISFSGCDTGTPILATYIGADNGVGTAFSIPGGVASKPDCLVVGVLSTGTDVTSTAMASGWASTTTFVNPSLTEQMDNWHVTGDGGGFAMAVGGLAGTGPYAPITGTLTTGNTKALMSFVLRGPQEPIESPLRLEYGYGYRGGGFGY